MDLGKLSKKTTGWEIVKKMLEYVWPAESSAMKVRVVVAMALLLGSKVRLPTHRVFRYCAKIVMCWLFRV